ncbi:MAG: transcriptional regulator [Flammeovirgaceae bacterium]|nr:transcriptional regulator [Flammeovirgaceae bacterium]MBE63026.1 transcriptional regulator [Flammeovirgaceae bacterium]
MNKTKINKLKLVLVEKGKTNKWLADELGMNETTISRWCTNDIQPPLEKLLKIARLLDVDIKELLVSSKITV